MIEQQQLIDEFFDKGYCVVKNILQPDEIASLAVRLLEVEKNQKATKDINCSSVTHIDEVIMTDPSLAIPFNQPCLLAILRRLIGERLRLTLNAVSITRPGKPRGNLHTDWPYNPTNATCFQPPFNEHPVGHITVILMITPFTVDNGATSVVPTSHKWSMTPYDPRVVEDRFATFPGEVQVIGDAGSALVFDTRIWHCSPAFIGKKGQRIALIARFAAWWLNLETLAPNSFLRSKWVEGKGQFEDTISKIDIEAISAAGEAKHLLQHWLKD